MVHGHVTLPGMCSPSLSLSLQVEMQPKEATGSLPRLPLQRSGFGVDRSLPTSFPPQFQAARRPLSRAPHERRESLRHGETVRLQCHGRQQLLRRRGRRSWQRRCHRLRRRRGGRGPEMLLSGDDDGRLCGDRRSESDGQSGKRSHHLVCIIGCGGRRRQHLSASPP